MSQSNYTPEEIQTLEKLNLDPNSKNLKLEIQAILDKIKKPSGYYTFVATTKTTSKIENYSWIIKDKKTGEVVASESLATENTLNKSLKKGGYTISCEVIDEDGISGIGESEVVVK